MSGVQTQLGAAKVYYAPKVILANGTFLNGMMHFGKVQIEGWAKASEPALVGLTEQPKVGSWD